MNQREIVLASLNHRQPAAVPRDFGGTNVTGIHCSLVAELRDHFGLAKRLVKVPDISSCIGWIDEDLAGTLGCSVAMALPIGSTYGNPVGEWKEWRAPWGQDILVPEGFGFRREANGDVLVYPQGDVTVPASGRMPASSFFTDAIIRPTDFDEDHPNPRDNAEEYKILDSAAVARIVANCRQARASGRAVTLSIPGTSIGDIARVPGQGLKHPKGIRDIEEWYVSVSLRPDYLKEVFRLQTEVALANLEQVFTAGGRDLCDVVHVCGTDFGTQIGTFCSLDTFHDLYGDSYRRLCGWIHDNTPCKTFKHSCGAVASFIDAFVEVGFDILNPVQCSAAGMEAKVLKDKYGSRITFWGGGVDTQKTLPFGTPEEVRREVLERLAVFSPDGGFVFSPVHNTQARTPLVNFLAMLSALDEFAAAGR